MPEWLAAVAFVAVLYLAILVAEVARQEIDKRRPNRVLAEHWATLNPTPRRDDYA